MMTRKNQVPRTKYCTVIAEEVNRIMNALVALQRSGLHYEKHRLVCVCVCVCVCEESEHTALQTQGQEVRESHLHQCQAIPLRFPLKIRSEAGMGVSRVYVNVHVPSQHRAGYSKIFRVL
jgi:hypothetical protein